MSRYKQIFFDKQDKEKYFFKFNNRTTKPLTYSAIWNIKVYKQTFWGKKLIVEYVTSYHSKTPPPREYTIERLNKIFNKHPMFNWDGYIGNNKEAWKRDKKIEKIIE